MTDRVDCYPTRDGGATRLVSRAEPVVYGARSGPLSAAELAAYDRDGVVVLEDVVRPADLRATLEVLTAAERVHGDVDEGVIREPGTGSLRSIFDVHGGRGPLARLSRDPFLVAAARQILGDDVYIHQSRVNFKPALGGSGFSWHSDFETWHAEDGMPRMRAVSVSILFDDNEPWNGPLFVLPGSHRTFVSCPRPTPPEHHKTSLVAQEVGTPSHDALRTLFDRVGRIEVATGRAGSVVLFDCNALHASAANLSPVPRRNFFLVYNAMSNALEAPFAETPPRPGYLASRRAEAISDDQLLAD